MNICIFLLYVKKIGFMRFQCPVTHAVADDYGTKIVLHRIDH